MKNSILLRERPALVKGRVILDYTRKGKILERIEGDNMCFESAFNATNNWWDKISGASAHIFMYGSDKAPDPTMPYQRRGTVIGWGFKGKVASGAIQGAWNAAKSFDNKVIKDGDGISFKWAYDWGVTQMVGLPIKSLGMGYDPVYGYLSRYEKRFTYDTGYVSKGYLGYLFDTSGTNRLIKVRSLKQQLIFNDINVAAFVKTDYVSGDYWNFGFASDTGKAYILLYNGNTGQTARRLLYEFADDTFTSLVATYPIINGTCMKIGVNGIVVYKNKIYIPNANIIEYDFVADTSPVTYTQPISPIAIGGYNSGGKDASCSAAENGLMFKGKHLIRVRQEWWTPVFNMETKTYEPECIYGPYESASYYASYIEPMIDGSPVVHANGHSGATQSYFMTQMLSCYTLPSDAPDRPEDSGVSLDYQIDISYI